MLSPVLLIVFLLSLLSSRPYIERCEHAITDLSRPILLVTNDFPTRVGGIETFALALAHGLSPHIVVYTASMPGDAAYDRGLPFPVYRDPSGILLPTPSVARRVAEVMRRHGCDSVIFGASVPLGLLAPALRRAGAERIVALTHGHEVWWAKVPLTRLILRRVGDSVDAMTYVSEWCRDRIAPALSTTAQARMVRVSPGVDLTRFHPGCGGSRSEGSWGSIRRLRWSCAWPGWCAARDRTR